MMKRNSILSVLKMALALSLVFSFAACDSSGDDGDDGDDLFAGTALYEVSWNGAFNPDFTSDSVTLVDAADTVLATSTGAMMHNTAGASTQVQTGGFFPSGTGALLQFAGGAWGGVHFELSPLVDVSAATKVYVAVKGDLAETAYFGMKMIAGSEAEVNFLNYPSKAGAGGWTVYTIALSDFTGCDFTTFKGFGLWNPNVVDGTLAERDVAANYPVLSDILISVAFGE